DRLVVAAGVGTGDCALQRSPAPPTPALAVDVRAGVEKQARDAGQAGRPRWIEVEARGARKVERCPATPRVDAGRNARLAANLGLDPGRVAEYHRGWKPRVRQLGVVMKHPRGGTNLEVDAEAQKPHDVLGDRRVACLDLPHQRRPARLTKLARE